MRAIPLAASPALATGCASSTTPGCLLWSWQCEAFVERIIRSEVNVGRIGHRVHSWSAQPEHEAISLTLPGRALRHRAFRLILVLTILVAASSSAVLAADTADMLLQRALYFSDLYNWRAARPYFRS